MGVALLKIRGNAAGALKRPVEGKQPGAHARSAELGACTPENGNPSRAVRGRCETAAAVAAGARGRVEQ